MNLVRLNKKTDEINKALGYEQGLCGVYHVVVQGRDYALWCRDFTGENAPVTDLMKMAPLFRCLCAFLQGVNMGIAKAREESEAGK